MWTYDDLEQIKLAIMELSMGKRLVRIHFTGLNGESQQSEYAQADLPQLRQLSQEIQAYLTRDDERFEVIYTHKGL